MASGLPDFYRGVDITYQTLAQIVNRPKYGAANLTAAAVTVVASAETEILSVSGKGMIYGGDIAVSFTSTQENSVPVMEVDGNNIAERNFLSANYDKVNKEHSSPLYQLKYDRAVFRFTMGLSHGITFESSFRLLYQEKHGVTPPVTARAIYALV